MENGSYVLLDVGEDVVVLVATAESGLHFGDSFGQDGQTLLGLLCLLWLIVGTSAQFGGFSCGGCAIATSLILGWTKFVCESPSVVVKVVVVVVWVSSNLIPIF